MIGTNGGSVLPSPDVGPALFLQSLSASFDLPGGLPDIEANRIAPGEAIGAIRAGELQVNRENAVFRIGDVSIDKRLIQNGLFVRSLFVFPCQENRVKFLDGPPNIIRPTLD